MQVTIYSKPQCAQCDATYRMFDMRGIKYNIINVIEDRHAFDYVLSLGYKQMPVVVAGALNWAGFRPDKINSIEAPK